MRYVMMACAVVLAVTVLADDKGRKNHTGLVAHYYQDHRNWYGHWPDTVSVPDADPKDWTFTEYKYSRVEPLVNHLFEKRGWFSVRWVGYLDTVPGSSGKDDDEDHEYTFEIFADDGCRLFIDEKRIINDWQARWEKTPEAVRKSGPVKLSSGKHRIVVEYFQGQSLKKDDHDPMKLYWSCPSRSIPRQIIPASHFSHTESDKKSTGR